MSCQGVYVFRTWVDLSVQSTQFREDYTDTSEGLLTAVVTHLVGSLIVLCHKMG